MAAGSSPPPPQLHRERAPLLRNRGKHAANAGYRIADVLRPLLQRAVALHFDERVFDLYQLEVELIEHASLGNLIEEVGRNVLEFLQRGVEVAHFARCRSSAQLAELGNDQAHGVRAQLAALRQFADLLLALPGDLTQQLEYRNAQFRERNQARMPTSPLIDTLPSASMTCDRSSIDWSLALALSSSACSVPLSGSIPRRFSSTAALATSPKPLGTLRAISRTLACGRALARPLNVVLNFLPRSSNRSPVSSTKSAHRQLIQANGNAQPGEQAAQFADGAAHAVIALADAVIAALHLIGGFVRRSACALLAPTIARSLPVTRSFSS